MACQTCAQFFREWLDKPLLKDFLSNRFFLDAGKSRFDHAGLVRISFQILTRGLMWHGFGARFHFFYSSSLYPQNVLINYSRSPPHNINKIFIQGNRISTNPQSVGCCSTVDYVPHSVVEQRNLQLKILSSLAGAFLNHNHVLDGRSWRW